MKRGILLILCVFAIGALFFLMYQYFMTGQKTFSLPSNFTSNEPHFNQPFSVWDWQPLDSEPASSPELFSQLSKQKVKVLYKDINVTVDDSEITDPQLRQQKLETHFLKLHAYVQQAKQAGITVHALVGTPDWAFSSHRYLTTNAIQVVNDYNTRFPDAPLTGIQFDVEPFTQPEFLSNPDLGLRDFLTMVSGTQQELIKSNSTLELGFAIPAWLDGTHPDMPAITWQRKTDHTFTHLLSILSQREHNYLVLMAYRNVADGEDGVITFAAAEMAAAAQTPTIKMLIGQELNDETPAKITYFGFDKASILKEVALIDQHFSTSPQYQGIAFHDLSSFTQKFR